MCVCLCLETSSSTLQNELIRGYAIEVHTSSSFCPHTLSTIWWLWTDRTKSEYCHTSNIQASVHSTLYILIPFEDCKLIGIKVAEGERGTGGGRERKRERERKRKDTETKMPQVLFPYCCTLSLTRLWVWQWFPARALLESLHHLVHLHVFSSLDGSQTCKVRFMILLLITTESLEKLKGCNKDRAMTLIISLKRLSFSRNTLPKILIMRVK